MQRDFLRCPHCLRKLKDPCVNCAKPLDPDWSICPYCEQEVPGTAQPASARRGSRRRERLAADTAALGETAAFEVQPPSS